LGVGDQLNEVLMNHNRSHSVAVIETFSAEINRHGVSLVSLKPIVLQKVAWCHSLVSLRQVFPLD
jgi:hypothetical protein